VAGDGEYVTATVREASALGNMSVVLTDVAAARSPSTGREIVDALEAVHEEGVAYWSRFSDAEFFARIGSHWSPAEHVRHLTRSMTPLLPALRMPKFALRAAFGSASREPMTYEAMQATYARALNEGGTAGRFTPSEETGDGGRPRRDAIRDDHSETVRGLTAAMARWTEAQLDRYRLPHPLLGKLSVREMLLFTVLHNEHHMLVAERRLREMGAG
jgi:DinB superfamily